MHRVLAYFAIVFLVRLTPATFAQQGTSEIGGRVTDEQGAVLKTAASFVRPRAAKTAPILSHR